jgi:hypothetical protein
MKHIDNCPIICAERKTPSLTFTTWEPFRPQHLEDATASPSKCSVYGAATMPKHILKRVYLWVTKISKMFRHIYLLGAIMPHLIARGKHKHYPKRAVASLPPTSYNLSLLAVLVSNQNHKPGSEVDRL